MSTTLRCALIGSGQQLIACAERWLAHGHGVVGVVSACQEVCAWADARGIARCAPQDDQVGFLAREPFDYLFSIVNHAITPRAVLALPQRLAINYHDSPLPRYAGFNATAWAIVEGQTSHAVSWHEMTPDVDGGRILLQAPVEIRDDDTAFTLGVKCAEAGVSSFEELVQRLTLAQQDHLSLLAPPASVAGDFHTRSDRPDLALLDFRRPARELHALVRGLNFGPDDSWMCKPKLVCPRGLLVVLEAALGAESARPAEPGRVLELSARGVEVATADGVLLLSELCTLEGTPVQHGELETRFGLRTGCTLEPPPAALLDGAHEFDRATRKHERFWVERLARLRSPALAELTLAQETAEPALLAASAPAALRALPAAERAEVLLAAWVAYLGRVQDEPTFDLAFDKALPAGLSAAYAAATPLRCEVRLEVGFDPLRQALREELVQQDRRGSYARDCVLRYRRLRERLPLAPLPVAVRLGAFDPAAPPALVEGARLSLLVSDTGEYAFAYDRRSISAEAVARIGARVGVLLEAALAEPSRALAELPLLSSDERELLLKRWQDTSVPYAEECVHTLFERQVARTPDAVAAVFGAERLSYRELNQRANRMAEKLRAAGAGPEQLVGICVERSLDLVVGLLGILKAGSAYVPLDPVYPRERLAMMLEDAKAPLLLTQRRLASRLPETSAQQLYVDEIEWTPERALENVDSGVQPEQLAYVIFTSGSTGRPKGVMVRHRNVANFFCGMDAALGDERGVWLAVTSVSFDISVLELFWTLTRGFQVVIQPESDRASLSRKRPTSAGASSARMDFGLFYFAADSARSTQSGNAYRLLLEGAKFADTHDFTTVWTPERHFHAFGGLYPNPAVTTAALATITQRVALRAGSVVLPLHDPLRVAEDWAVIDQLSNGRVGLSFASGWHVNDFAFFPERYERRREIMLESIETVLKLWRGETISVKNGAGQPIEVSVLPRPIQARPPLWIASAGSVDTFKLAGKLGVNVLTNMLGQDLADLEQKLAAYRAARREHGHEGPGQVTVMLHTFVCGDTEEARRLARKPFCDYLASSFDLVKVAPWMFPAFRQPSRQSAADASFDASAFTPEDLEALLDHAFERYFDSAGLFGTPERALGMVERLKRIGVDELACLIDFGIDPEVVLASLPHLDRLRQLSNVGEAAAQPLEEDTSIATQLQTHRVTHLQCTPSMARMLLTDPAAREGLRGLKRLLLGGEALPPDLLEQLRPWVGGEILNMYGPTETTVWSTSANVTRSTDVSIGKPIANTVIRILDARGQLAPLGAPGELCIGGAGVVRGYLGRDDLTQERFVADPCDAQGRLYRTGDLARYRADGDLEFLGRLDHQVKINGYRIELGEIESALARHPGVRQAVVSARSDAGAAQLVAYCVPAVLPASDEATRVASWQSLWDETYRHAGADARSADVRFDTAGWNDSYSGAAIPADQMREWVDATIERVHALDPKRVLEIGCGSGMLLYRLIDQVERYTGVDLSAHALANIRRELRPDELARVQLLQRPAHALEELADGSYDVVILNSVIQYFPDAGYLARVIRRASELVADGGHIFLGDVRSLAHQRLFQGLVELHRAPALLPAAELGPRIERRVADDGELVLSPAFFHALVAELPRLAAVDVRLKPARAHNEMSCFRYDVVLHVGRAPLLAATDALAPVLLSAPERLESIAQALAERPPVLLLRDVENARVSGAAHVRQQIEAGATTSAGALLEQLKQVPPRGIDPDGLTRLDPDYHVELCWAQSGDASRFDAVLRHRQLAPQGRWPFEPPGVDGPAARHANTPARGGNHETLAQELRAHLRELLPEYMVPAVFVTMDALPLTPNGKIDRKALPAPAQREPLPAPEYQAPSNTLEQLISEVWRELLALPRVDRTQNIFDLGANSLLTVQAHQRLMARLGRKIPLVSMFRFPSVEALATHLGGEPPTLAATSTKREHERAERKKDVVARRRELRQERGAR